MRWLSLLVTITVCTFAYAAEAPSSIQGKTIKYVLDKTTGEFAQYKGHIFQTKFLENNIYTDLDSTTGVQHDLGEYHYFKSADDKGELHYHIETTGPWKGMHLVETLTFTEPNKGKVDGRHAGDFECGYSGTFTIQDSN